MVMRKLVVKEPLGLHLRPAGVICETSLLFQSRISIKKGTQTANAKSVLGILAARVTQGDEIEIICDGVDENEALEAIVNVFEAREEASKGE